MFFTDFWKDSNSFFFPLWINIDFMINISIIFFFVFFFNLILEENIKKIQTIHLIVCFFLFTLLWNSDLFNYYIWNNLEDFSFSVNLFQIYNPRFLYFIFIFILFLLFIGFCSKMVLIHNKDFEFTFLILLFFISSFSLFLCTDLISIFVTLECISLSSYVLIGLERKNKLNAITGIRYLILSTIPSSFFILGCIFLYEYYGTFVQKNIEILIEFSDITLESNNYLKSNLYDISFFEKINLRPISTANLENFYSNINIFELNNLKENNKNFDSFKNLILHDTWSLSLYLSIFLLLITLLFKITAAPFHVWAPIIYNQGPISSVTFLATFSKFVIFLFIINLFSTTFYFAKTAWSLILIGVGILSIFSGLLGAFFQQFIRKFFVYSSVTNIGFLVLGFAFYTAEIYKSLLFYLFIYTISSIFTWFILLYFHKDARFLINLQDGLRNNPLLSFMFSIMIFSLAGIPPFGGFFIKFDILTILTESSYFWITFILLLATVINFYYYLRLIKIIYFEKLNSRTTKKVVNPVHPEKAILFIFILYFVCFFEFFAVEEIWFIFNDFFFKSLAK